MGIADREFEEAVPKALQQSLEFVNETGTQNTMEWLRRRYAYFMHHTFTVDVGSGANLRRLYATTLVTLSEDRDAIVDVANEMGKIIGTDY